MADCAGMNMSPLWRANTPRSHVYIICISLKIEINSVTIINIPKHTKLISMSTKPECEYGLRCELFHLAMSHTTSKAPRSPCYFSPCNVVTKYPTPPSDEELEKHIREKKHSAKHSSPTSTSAPATSVVPTPSASTSASVPPTGMSTPSGSSLPGSGLPGSVSPTGVGAPSGVSTTGAPPTSTFVPPLGTSSIGAPPSSLGSPTSGVTAPGVTAPGVTAPSTGSGTPPSGLGALATLAASATGPAPSGVPDPTLTGHVAPTSTVASGSTAPTSTLPTSGAPTGPSVTGPSAPPTHTATHKHPKSHKGPAVSAHVAEGRDGSSHYITLNIPNTVCPTVFKHIKVNMMTGKEVGVSYTICGKPALVGSKHCSDCAP